MNTALQNNKNYQILVLIVLVLSIQAFRPAEANSIENDASEFFYQELAPYGNWVHHPAYGRVWYPLNVPDDWRPYSNGYWEYTDEFGWLWISDWEWGWAAFHYGRWLWDDWYGWLWIPGRIWAPAWVFWRYGGGYASWAPMPPQFIWNPYVGVNNYYYANHHRYLRRNCWVSVRDRDFPRRGRPRRILPPSKNTLIFKKTRPLGPITLANQTIANRGVPINQIEIASGERLPRVKNARVTSTMAEWKKKRNIINGEIVILRPFEVKSVPDQVAKDESNARRIAEKNPLIGNGTEVRHLQKLPIDQSLRPGRLMGEPMPSGYFNRNDLAIQPANRKLSEIPALSLPLEQETGTSQLVKPKNTVNKISNREQRQEKFLQQQQLELERQLRREESLMRQEAEQEKQLQIRKPRLQSQDQNDQIRLQRKTLQDTRDPVRPGKVELQRQQEGNQHRFRQETEREKRQWVRLQETRLRQQQQQEEQFRMQQEALQEQKKLIQLRGSEMQHRRETEQRFRQNEVMQQQEALRRQQWQTEQRQWQQQEYQRRQELQQQQGARQPKQIRSSESSGGGISGHRGQRNR